ncbi:unnamed protein product [Blepharisma stoltei]|uniref:Uncharacterized protein n=1 Tax=Blepharisma stoltei TaxID=1481888 RepID=A0AAU9ITK5_9CILI|nr:unnamed protein product [Blepharisma stoltei]
MKNIPILSYEEVQQNVFMNMFSLLSPMAIEGQWPVSLNLPGLSFIGRPPTSEDVDHHTIDSSYKLEDEGKRKAKEITACPHTDRKHYAKNMCNNCYHRLGRDKQAWACPHQDRQHYAKGKCQMCYLQHYHKARTHGRKKGRRMHRFNVIKEEGITKI